MKGVFKVAMSLVVLAAVVHFMAMPSEAISCGQVESSLAPCLQYLLGGGTPSGTCCTGVKTLNGMLYSKLDRQTACNCLKSAAQRNPSIKPDAAASLPGKCGVSLPVPISPTTNCNAIP
ncbi:hypothetical protein M9H77_15494 [Catharanthus roseus]|uniref:Uncharacterized protein n=1 Tax=Catharanthus roseus TaxID=4058 RepID=A0ACC0B0V7_CATRO|nr:hypothetical protein M9H77_15494 [Catharanthus roseus]